MQQRQEQPLQACRGDLLKSQAALAKVDSKLAVHEPGDHDQCHFVCNQNCLRLASTQGHVTY